MSNDNATFVHFVTDTLGINHLSRAQRVYVRVVFDRVDPIDLGSGDDLDLARKLFGPVDRVPEQARGVVCTLKGARVGGTHLHSLFLLYRALTASLNGIALGESGYAVIVAPDLRLARQGLNYVKGAADFVPAIKRAVIADTSDSITIKRPHDGARVVIECLPASRGGAATRGRSFVAGLLDEASFMRDEESGQVNDAEVYRSIAPRIITGGTLAVISTVWTASGLLWERVQKNHGKPTTALACIAPTLVMRDDDTIRNVVSAERERDPLSASREFDCIPLESESTLFDPADIDAAVDDREETPRVPDRKHAMAVDLATRSDFSVALVGHRRLISRAGQPPLDQLYVDCARCWQPTRIGKMLKRKIDVEELEEEIAKVAQHYRCSILADGWSFDFFEARCRARGLVLTEASMAPSEQSKRASLLSAYFRQRRIRLPNNPELIKQLKNLRITRTSGGNSRFAAPSGRGQHDDFPKALLLLLPAVTKLPAGGGDISYEWGPKGRIFFTVDEQTGETVPCTPPVNSPEWLDAAYEALTRGVYIQGMSEWLQQEGNADLARQKAADEREFRAAMIALRHRV